MPSKNNLHAYVDYCNEIFLHEEALVISTILEIIEIYFQKQVYLDEELFPRFLESNKKITISLQLAKKIIKRLVNLKKTYTNQNKINKYKFLNSIIKVKVIKEIKNGYQGVDQYENKCFIPSANQFTVGETAYLYCTAVVDDVMKLVSNVISASYVVNMITNYAFQISVQKYRKDELLVFSYSGQQKFGSENLKKLKYYFLKEKIIFNQR
jgi:hypothetical protein